MTPKGELICPDCRERLQYVEEPACMRCGKPIASEQEEYCTDCRRRTFHYERGFAVFIYDDVMQRAVAEYKYCNKKEFAEFFATEMAMVFRSRLKNLGAEGLVPVPIHAARKRYRGYNQTEVLCRKLSQRIGVPVLDMLARNRNTAPQKELDASDRLRNLERAIVLNAEALQGRKLPKTVLLVDDIYTTGSTAEACARILLRSGVDKVYIFSLCIGTER